MNDPLVPDRSAGQRSNVPEVEASCCSPIRAKLNTTPIKCISAIYLPCGVISIALGVVACIMDCLFKGLSIPAGAAFIATAIVGLFVSKHGGMAVVYGFLNAFSFMFATAVVVFMLIALPLRESNYHPICSSYDCHDPYDPHKDNCCEEFIYDMKWKNVAVDLSILVVGLIIMVTSLLACTLSLRDLNWIDICFLKKKEQNRTNSTQTTQDGSVDETPASGDQSMKRCWKPCDNKCHKNVSVAMGTIHIIIGLVCVGLGILAAYFGCRYAHIGMPIWTGILIFIVTGIFGLMSVYNKDFYIPCYFALSILAFFLAINMFTWAAVNITEEEECYYGCVQWGCSDISTPSYYSYGRHCYDCLPGCCYNGNVCNRNKETYRMWVDGFIIGFGILEMLICMVTIGLSFSQLSCYVCCRGCCDCSCCYPQTNGAYQMVMTSNGNLVMVPVPNAQQGIPTMVNHQPMVIMPQQQPMVHPTNQATAIQVSSQTPVHPFQQQMVVQGQMQGQPMLVQGQPLMFQGQQHGAMVQPAAQTGPAQGLAGDTMTQVTPPQVHGDLGACGGVPDQENLSNPTV